MFLFKKMLVNGKVSFVKDMQKQHWKQNGSLDHLFFFEGTPSGEKHVINMAAIIKVERK